MTHGRVTRARKWGLENHNPSVISRSRTWADRDDAKYSNAYSETFAWFVPLNQR